MIFQIIIIIIITLIILMSTIIQDTLQSDWFLITLSDLINPLEFYNLKYVSKRLNKLINDDFMNQIISNFIINKLKTTFDEHYDIVINYIKIHNLVLSGDYLIQCLMDNCYDIKIDLYDYLGTTKNNNLVLENTDMYPKSFIFFGPNYNKISTEYFDLKIHYINTMPITNFQTFTNHIINTYDLDICKNTFTFINNKPALYIHTPFKLLRKFDKINANNLDSATKDRILKYRQEGFNIKCV